jgi:hypothetical protein
VSNEQFSVGMVEAMFEYLERLEHEIAGTTVSDELRRSQLGLPLYAFRDPLITRGNFPTSSAPVKFVFVSERRREQTAPPNHSDGRPAGTIDDADVCRTKGLCFPNHVRQHFTMSGQELVLTRNRAPYGRNHGIVRSANHEPQAQWFEHWRLAVALHVARALGSETARSSYEIWVAGEGFNTQWHFHLQFRKQRSPIWDYLANEDSHIGGTRLLAEYPSRPVYFQSADEDDLIQGLSREVSPLIGLARKPAMGILAAFDHNRWRVLFVRSWPTERIFDKQAGLHEHLGEVILETPTVYTTVANDVDAACRALEDHLTAWCRVPCSSRASPRQT